MLDEDEVLVDRLDVKRDTVLFGIARVQEAGKQSDLPPDRAADRSSTRSGRAGLLARFGRNEGGGCTLVEKRRMSSELMMQFATGRAALPCEDRAGPSSAREGQRLADALLQ